MPSELVSCPECQRKLRVPEDLVGKQVKCPTCGHTFTADPAAHAPPPPAPVEEKATRTSKVSRDEKDEDDEDEERSRRKRLRSSRDDDDDDDDRRRRRSRSGRDDDDDDDDRPRRRRRGSSGRDFLPHRGGAVLALGIMGLFGSFFVPLGGLVCGIIAWVMANTDLAQMRAGRMDPEGESQTNAGRICGIIGVVLHVLILLVAAAFFMCACAGAMGGANGAAGARH
jgi:predicted Zn finger-like uncharacterized protein